MHAQQNTANEANPVAFGARKAQLLVVLLTGYAACLLGLGIIAF